MRADLRYAIKQRNLWVTNNCFYASSKSSVQLNIDKGLGLSVQFAPL